MLIIFIGMMMLMTFSVSAEENPASSELPPEVIRTSDPYLLSLVGYIPVKDDKGIIGSNRVQLYAQPEKDSAVVAVVQPGAEIAVKDAMAYIYPRMSRIVITKSFTAKGGISHFPSRDVHFKKGDTLYVLCVSTLYDCTMSVWYKGNFSNVSTKHFKIPYCIYPAPADNSYGIYEGYINPLDKVPAREIQIEDDRVFAWLGKRDGRILYLDGSVYDSWNEESGSVKQEQFFCRRNADIWLKVETEEGKIGWMLVSEARLGAAQNLVQFTISQA